MKKKRTNFKKITAEEKERRLDEVEELLCKGTPSGEICSSLSEKYKILPNQVRLYTQAVYERWRGQTSEDAPHRREKVIRMAEKFYSSCLEKNQFSAASSTLVLLARLSGAFTAYDPARQRILDELGPPPNDPTRAVVWAQRAMLAAMHEILTNSAIDPERRIRLLADLGSKVGYTHAKALIEAKVDEVRERVFPAEESDDKQQITDASGISWPETSRFGGS